MPKSVANQRIVRVHREQLFGDFLGIKNANWQYAARDLGAQSLMLYLYFAANANNYEFALSPAAIRQTIGMPTSTYRDQFLRLIDKGYLVQRGNNSNIYDFYETPQRVTHITQEENAACAFECAAEDIGTTQTANNKATEDREINNKYIDTINTALVEQVPQAATNHFEF